jgi:exodeoxyribonuclease III
MRDAPETIGVLAMNIGNPSRERAERQLEWLQERPEHVLVLTETAPSAGCDLIAERLEGARWQVRFPRPGDGERGVLIASRVGLTDRSGNVVSYLPARAERATLAGDMLDILGVYVPSRDSSVAKTERKRRFIDDLSNVAQKAPAHGVLIGDLNIIEPSHQPAYAWLQEWEYDFYEGLLTAGWVDAYRLRSPEAIEHSWVSYDGEGYRYDHAFVSAPLADRVVDCAFVHETRDLKLTDHSAMTLVLRLGGAQPLEVDEDLAGEPPTLF